MRNKVYAVCLLLLTFVSLCCLPASAQTQTGSAPTCTQLAILDGVTVTTKILTAVPLTSTTINVNGVPTTSTVYSTRYHICSIHYRVNQPGTPGNFGLKTGTGTNCGTGTASLTPQWTGKASGIDDIVEPFTASGALVVPNGKDLCLGLSAAPTGAQIEISYANY